MATSCGTAAQMQITFQAALALAACGKVMGKLSKLSGRSSPAWGGVGRACAGASPCEEIAQ